MAGSSGRRRVNRRSRIVSEWIQWAVVLGAAFGLAAIVRDADIFAWPRGSLAGSQLGARLVKCWLCIGFWAGLSSAYVAGLRGKCLVLAPLVSSGFVYVAGVWLGTMQVDDL